MTDEEIVAALTEACEAIWPSAISNQHTADALLPVVRRVAEQRAAEELLAAAEVMTEDVNGGRIWRDVIRHVHERAEALDLP